MWVVSSVCLAAVDASVAEAFGTSLAVTDLAVSISSLVFMPMFIVSTLLFYKYECRTVLQMACVVMFIGAWIRVFAAINDAFWWVILGQGILACAGPALTSAISVIASTWFAESEAGIATSLMSLANPLGALVSLTIQGIWSHKVTEKISGMT